MRDYVDNRSLSATLGPDDRIEVPTAVALFAHQFIHEGTPPQEWVQRLYDVRCWTSMPTGGHFAAAEEPNLMAADIAAFFSDL